MMNNIPNYFIEIFPNRKGSLILSNSWKISNYGLAIDKFGRINDGKLDYINSDDNNLYHIFNTNHYKGILKYIKTKETRIKTKLTESNFAIEQIEVEQNWRLVLNLGASTAYNNGFLLHSIYGLPYLADTAIKGMLRTYVIENYFDSKEEEAINDDDFVLLFGQGNNKDNADKETIGKKGLITFANAFPVNTNFDIKADIINNHHKDYYADSNTSKYPTDTESPNMIKFITLINAKFAPYFYTTQENKNIKISATSELTTVKSKTILEAIQQLLLEAFKYKGIGAKTNLAYGRLKEDKAKKRKAEKIKKDNLEKQQRKTKLQENGISELIAGLTNYGKIKETIKYYKENIDIDVTDILPEADHQILIEVLKNSIKKKLNKHKESLKAKIFKDSIYWIGEEKAKQWFNQKKQ